MDDARGKIKKKDVTWELEDSPDAEERLEKIVKFLLSEKKGGEGITATLP